MIKVNIKKLNVNYFETEGERVRETERENVARKEPGGASFYFRHGFAGEREEGTYRICVPKMRWQIYCCSELFIRYS